MTGSSSRDSRSIWVAKSAGGRPLGGAFELEQELQDTRTGGRGQRVGLGGGVVSRAEQRTGLLDRVVAPEDAIGEVEPPPRPELVLQSRFGDLDRLDLDAGDAEGLGELDDDRPALGDRGILEFQPDRRPPSSLCAAATSIFASRMSKPSGLTPVASA